MRSKTDGRAGFVPLVCDAAPCIGRRHRYDTIDGKEQKQKEQQRLLFFDGKLIP